jgi:multiple sugar transport system permease protein/raffinose/stachyose/melibiose transport system permease protein
MVISAIDTATAGKEGARRPRRAPRPRGGSDAPGRRGSRKHRWLWFLLPSLLLVGFFFVLPFVLNVPFAFSQWSSYSSSIPFVGFDNFTLMWQSGALGGAIRITLIYAVIAMAVQNVVALTLAHALRDSNRVNTFFRSLYFLPVLMSPLAAGYVWRGIVDPAGPLNAAIAVVVPGFDYAWLGHPVSAVATVAFVDGWKWSGIATLVYIAGLNSIPSSVKEAALVDGANGWTRFWRITVPLLAPAFTFNITTTLVGALSAYDVIAAATNGGPGTSTTTLNVAVQQQFSYGYFGTASMLSLTVTLLVIAVAVPLVSWLRKREVVG